MSVLADAWVSRAAAKQRRGRAGRVSPGARFALFSRAQFARMSDHQPPEMLRTPLQQLCLNVKAMAPGVGVETTLCAAPTPPPRDAVRAALDELMALRALDVRRDSATSASSDGAVSSDAEKHPNNPETLTPLGKHLAHMPVDARVGKMLLFGALLGCLDPILTIAAAMSGRQLFVSPKDKVRSF
jgi:ATP-dependent RNA helicase DHX57